MVPALQLHIPPGWEWPSKPRCLHETYGGRIAAHGSVQLKTCEPPVKLTMFSAWAGLASQSLTFINRALGRPGPQSPHFYRQGARPARPPMQALTFIDKALGRSGYPPLIFIDRSSSLLSTGPGQPGSQSLTSVGRLLISIGQARPRQSRKL